MGHFGPFGAIWGHIWPLWVIFGHFWTNFSSWGHSAVLPVKTTDQSGSQNHIKSPAARSQHGRQAGRQARRQARRQVPQAHCAGKGVCTGIILAIYGTLAIRPYANLPNLFIKSLNWPFSYHSVDDIHYHYHPLVFLKIIIIITKVWHFYFNRRKYA